MKKKIAIVIGVTLIQFIRIDKDHPTYEKSGDFLTVTKADKKTTNLIQSACYDCHSYDTEYPWYTNISPVSLWIGHHIEEAREHLNFSTWAEYDSEKKEHKIEEMIEEFEEGEMPLESFTWTHPEAKLSADEKQLVLNWFKSIQ
ncbi:MAG: heme-binding domain-containing protein [Flavobacteriales bacterium]|nr:heme-binding domain-containing protein [Flavobacteriales bacterium]